jgi:hypothetical protein
MAAPEKTEKEIKQNTIERSKSARASCKDCGATIAKGELRFGLVDFGFSDHGSYKYFHLTCAYRRRNAEVSELLRSSRANELEVSRAEIDAALAGATAPTAPASKETPDASGMRPTVVAATPPFLEKVKAGDVPTFVVGVDPPRTKEGHVLDDVLVAKLVTVMRDAKKAALLANVDEWIDELSLRDFMWRVFDRWTSAGAHMKDKWLFRNLVRTLDDAGALRLGQVIEGWVKGNKKIAVEAGLELLENHGTQSALLVIQSLAQRFHYKGAYNLAGHSLARVAKARETTVEDLEDWLVPTLGLDERGSRLFDYGPRSFPLRVSNELRVELVMEDGKTVLHGLPPERKSDDPAKVGLARRAFEQLRAELEKTLRVQCTRFEQALSTGRRWEPTAWEKHLWRHPVLKHIVRRLVWSGFAPGSDVPNVTFIVDESGDLMNVDLEKVELPKGKVGLIHPAELDRETRGKWGTVLSDFEIIQPFLQLGRPVREVSEADASADALTDYPKRPIAPGPLHGVLNRAGWIKSYPDDMRVYTFEKPFRFHNVTGKIKLDPGLWVTGHDDELQTPVEAFFVGRNGERVPLRNVGSVAVSEVLLALETLANASA